MILFSVVIPTCNRLSDLRRCLDCLSYYFDDLSQSNLGYQIEVIVSDDARDNVIRDQLSIQYPWCRYEQGPCRGPAANRNHGASVASGDWLVFTDDDCLPQPGWLEAYATYVSQADVLEGRTSACGQRTRVDQDSPINEMGGTLLSCNFAMRSALFRDLGGFNEAFPAPALEDNELYARIKQFSHTRLFVREALVLHPWRLRKGMDYQEVHACSVGLFVKLHPQYACNFTLFNQVLKVLRSLRATLAFSLRSGIYKGLFRQLWLDTYNYYLTWTHVRLCISRP